MTAEIVPLNANRALCADRAEIADRLEELARRIRSTDDTGDPLRRVLLVLDHEFATPVYTYGERTTTVYAVGLLEFAKSTLMRGGDPQ